MSMTINAAGGGSGLNFSIVCDVTQPTPRENMIWVNTGTPLNGYVFAGSAPEAPLNGMVWFKTTASASVAAFNALKKNELMVYPQSCFQYENGEWVEKTAKIYKNGAWVDWIVYYYYLGDQEASITGGWKTANGSAGVVSFEDGFVSLRYSGSGLTAANIYTNNKVDVSGKSYLKFEVEKISSGISVYCGLTTNNTSNDGVLNLLSWCNTNLEPTLTVNQKQIVSYDISAMSDTLADNYYVRVGVGTTAIKVYRVWVE